MYNFQSYTDFNTFSFSFLLQFYEDLLRKRADREVNNRDAIVIRGREEKHIYSKDIKVGIKIILQKKTDTLIL